jgi:anti-sigma B factor antagonist
MATRNSRLVIEDNGDITRVNFVDRNILEEAAIAQIGDEISQVIDGAAPPKVLISFENVEHLSSAALGTLITINNKIRAKGGQLRLSNIDKNIYEVFVITKLNKLFQIHDDVASALASFK